MTTATLVLQDGTIFQGNAFGAAADSVFELVFNTSMTGYQEILTDPSYRGQAVLFTVPHIGNVGINTEDYESAVPQVSATVIRSLSPLVSNWRAAQDLASWLAEHGVPGISGIDTRYLTRKLRDGGTQKAALSTCGTPAEELLRRANDWPGLDGVDMVKEVTCPEAYPWNGDAGDKWVRQGSSNDHQTSTHIVAYDFGIKRNILRHLTSYGGRVTVVPADTGAKEALQLHPDGIFLSNGPGDPAGLPYAAEAVKGLIKSGVPIFGICLGHQLIGRALGANTQRLTFGHHGGNHPVQHLSSGRVLITAQNHNYCVSANDLDPAEVEVSYKSLNDGSVEGMRLKHMPVISVQFHPEAAPGLTMPTISSMNSFNSFGKTNMTDFDERAKGWDEVPGRRERANTVADAIRGQVRLTPEMSALEYGCGTGLLSFALQPYLGRITLADSSAGMLEVVKEKITANELKNMYPLLLDLSIDPLPAQRFHFIYTLNDVTSHSQYSQYPAEIPGFARTRRDPVHRRPGQGRWFLP